MSILWIYDQPIDPLAGGTERATHLIMTGAADRGCKTAGFLVFRQDPPRAIYDSAGNHVDELYRFLKANDVHLVVNQIGYSKWLLEEFLARGGARWQLEGGRIVTNLHFDPLMFSTGLWDLLRHWHRRSPRQKLRRIARILLLPLERHQATRTLRDAYAFLLEKSDAYVILSETHRQKLIEMSGGRGLDRVHVIANPNTFPTTLAPGRVRLKSKTVLIVSRLDEPQKRVSLSLLAWGKVMRIGSLSDWTLKVIGDGEYRDDYQELVEKKRIPNVEFLGRKDPEPYYEEAALYLHTAKREGWGLTIAEAMQKGVVPLVMRSSGVFDELITDSYNGVLIKNGDVNSFAAQLAKLMQTREVRERIALRAIETLRTKDNGRIFDMWSELFGSTVSLGTNPSRPGHL